MSTRSTSRRKQSASTASSFPTRRRRGGVFRCRQGRHRAGAERSTRLAGETRDPGDGAQPPPRVSRGSPAAQRPGLPATPPLAGKGDRPPARPWMPRFRNERVPSSDSAPVTADSSDQGKRLTRASGPVGFIAQKGLFTAIGVWRAALLSGTVNSRRASGRSIWSSPPTAGGTPPGSGPCCSSRRPAIFPSRRQEAQLSLLPEWSYNEKMTSSEATGGLNHPVQHQSDLL